MNFENNMPKDKDKETSIFDISRLRELIELMQEHELNEVDLKQAEQRIRLRRGPDGVPVAYSAAPAAAPASAAPAPAAGDSAPAADDNSVYILSEAVGTFYSKPKPDKPNFVKVGDQVTEDTIVCLIEAMKLFNEVPAGLSGTIKEILVKDGDAVDHGMKLFRVEP
ncbi:Acetyl-CoA biotin carboxyl carrier [Mariniblastus fucicola]|uniref:Biotin carboxyl carrier protein of acetyl-CoA carboxylase n=2 Tax=Mariniblastus fucicola TaxID=980251 RepID=A0A5B9PDN7_9BACT|nr:Acetyl-CoA biotin carboxyl carrier [Mariniblastus fucicola]